LLRLRLLPRLLLLRVRLALLLGVLLLAERDERLRRGGRLS